jgi:hypothetical protein
MDSTMLRIPETPDELTPEWLTEALRAGGAIAQARVTAVESLPLGEGQGWRGQLRRLRLTYDAPQAGAPCSLVAKIGGIEDVCEIGFYREVAPRAALRTPRCYYAATDVEAKRYILLLEDLAPARCGDRMAGCSPDEAACAVHEIARFHAAWWDRPLLTTLDWLPDIPERWDMVSQARAYPRMWAQFCERAAHVLPEAILDIGAAVGRHLVPLTDHLFQTPPRTIIHFDYQLGNIFFDLPSGDAPLAVIDWQLISRGRGVTDIAYLLGQNMSIEARRASEMDLLRTYHQALLECGVRDYTFAQCLHDYRLYLVFALAAGVFTVILSDYTEENKRAYVDTLVPREVTAILDHGIGVSMLKDL